MTRALWGHPLGPSWRSDVDPMVARQKAALAVYSLLEIAMTSEEFAKYIDFESDKIKEAVFGDIRFLKAFADRYDLSTWILSGGVPRECLKHD